ncbi:MAG TPA: glycosyltransferase [Solirubrobacteraceae bacterium]|jgi:GT2 family glycosyltransferase
MSAAIPSAPAATPPASIVIPTRGRPRYLEVALASIAPQARAAGAEIVVVDDDGPSPTIHDLAKRFGARYEPHPQPLGLNVARNTGVERSHGELVAFVDDDVEVCVGWLDALLGAAHAHPHAQVFTGPIRPHLEGRAPRSCGREGPPITALDLGSHDTDEVRYAWGANMAVRRNALQRVGPFDVSLEHAGDEQEWQDRLAAACGPGRVRYIAAAALYHRRVGPDARLRALARAARKRGRAARSFDAWRDDGSAPGIAREGRTLAACAGHVVRRRCPNGLTMVAHSLGRLEQALRERRHPSHRPVTQRDPASQRGAAAERDDFLSGESGTVGGLDAARRELQDRALDTRDLLTLRRARIASAAHRLPPRRRVLVLNIARPEHQALTAAIHAELAHSRHEVELRTSGPGEGGKFENLNRLLAEGNGLPPQSQHLPTGHDWLLVIDDDVVLPRGFLDNFLFLAERFAFDFAQPAHRARSHAAWRVTRRRPGTLARQTPFVEIGPVTAFARRTFPRVLPFPGELRMGWGLDLHWAALAREHGWRCGVLDAVAIAHLAAPAGEAYSRIAAINEARAFLAERPYIAAREAQITIATHRSL